jgi:hypothetical protein
MEANKWLTQRFQLSKAPTVLLFRHGWMHMYTGSLSVKKPKKTIEKISKFVASGWSESPSMPVPPEPHVATEHEKTFHYVGE